MSENRRPGDVDATSSPAGGESKSLKDMLSDARARAKGQGVVQGSTVFFKNLAESIGHSNRNLKIGLAFLTAAFVVVAAALGTLVFQAFRSQVATKTTLEQQIQSMDASTRKQIQPIVDAMTAFEKKLAEQQEAQRRELEGVRALLQADLDTAKQDAAAARRDTAELRTSLKAVEKWADGFGKTYVQDRSNLDTRLRRLEGAPAPAPAPAASK
jgi:Spy/CpxP family protein refolding chaperone